MTPANLPRSVSQALAEAIARTGWTDALCNAAEQLPRILAMTPEQFEDYSKPIYNTMP